MTETKKIVFKPNWIHFSPYRMVIVYKPEFASLHKANKDVVKYCYGYKANNDKGLIGLMDRIVLNQKGHYRLIELYDNQTNDYICSFNRKGNKFIDKKKSNKVN